MANIIYEFEICDQIPQNIKIGIKLFHVFDDEYKRKNIILATNEDKVYGLGSNELGCLGLGHSNEVKELTELKELTHHKIVDLFASLHYCLAKTDVNKLFVWGSNKHGQLGIGHTSHWSKFFEPFQIEFSNTELIEHIECGIYHTLVLLTNGVLYGFGNNRWNQLGFGNNQTYCTPNRLSIHGKDLRFKYIYCFNSCSFAVTTNGELFSWGWNASGLLGHQMSEEICGPEIVNLNNVHKICSNFKNTYFLTTEGLIYFCGEYEENGNKQQNAPKKMYDPDIIITDLTQLTGSVTEKVVCIDSNNSFHTLNGNNFEKMHENYESFIDLYAKRFQITPQTVHICSGRPEKYFIIQNGIKVYPCDSGQKANDLVAKQSTASNSDTQLDELQAKFEKLESKVNSDNKSTKRLSHNLENETSRNDHLSKSLLEAKEEIKDLRLQMRKSNR